MINKLVLLLLSCELPLFLLLFFCLLTPSQQDASDRKNCLQSQRPFPGLAWHSGVDSHAKACRQQVMR